MNYVNQNPMYAYRPRRPRWLRITRAVAMVFVGALVAWGIAKVSGQSFTIIRQGLGSTVISIGADDDSGGPVLVKLDDDPDYEEPGNDKNRLDILLLGVRGADDPANGGMLTDSIMLLSVDTATGRAAMVSIPRDLTVRITDRKTAKINEAYVTNGLSGTRKLYSRILGTGIDNVVVVDFEAFRSVVDALGGITITLDEPFQETQQWAGTASESYVFSLPAGENTLDGQQALYYVRSRYSSSDFDRARRQQQVMVAIKNKVTGLDLAGDPIRALKLMTAVRKHIQTDMDILDLGTIRELLAQGDQLDKVRRYTLTTENLLYETHVDGIYELLPRDNTLSHIKEFIGSVVSESPVLPRPADPSPSVPTMSSPASASLEGPAVP